MRAGHQPLEPGRLHFDAAGTPASQHYGDVYHARAGALAQARHVFMAGNRLPQRWAGRDTFTICETGFGLGNNFLSLWQTWRNSPERPRRLHVLSFEAHPLPREALARGLASHTGEIRVLADALLDSWPPVLPGLHRLEFEGGQLSLTLAFGRVEHLARQVEARVDAFFLDGFSPDRNPAMWSRELFGQLVRIANEGATAATWCSAGQVRRDLAAAGFLVERVPGFGGKRQMSRAVLRPGMGKPFPRLSGEDVLVVGGGLAGAGIAHSMAQRGHRVTVLDPAFQAGLGGSHQGHRCAAMTPALSRDDNPMSRLSRAGILLAGLRWKALPQVARICGSLFRVEAEETESWLQSLQHWQFPEDWMTWCAAEHTLARCGLSLEQGGIWLGRGTQVRPSRLVASLLAQEGVLPAALQVDSLRRNDGGWQALGADGKVLAQAPRVVLAAAAETPRLLARALTTTRAEKLKDLQRMGGQIAYFRSETLAENTAIVAGAGYWLPADDGLHVGGSTYEFGTNVARATAEGAKEVAYKVAALTGQKPSLLMDALAQPSGWAGWRMSVRDHLPVIGPADVDESLWVACGFGSRGLSWMTLAGEIIAARMNSEPQVVERDLLRAVRLR